MTRAAAKKPERWPNLYVRARLPDGRQGVLHSLMGGGGMGWSEVRVLTDDYHEVSARLSACTVVKRDGPTIPYSDQVNHARIYPVERDNLARLREAVHGRQEMPVDEDLTAIAAAFGARPVQLALAL